jgi:hypothetical protein
MKKLTKRKLLTAIKSSPGGIISQIAEKCGVDWHTVESFIKTNPECMQAWTDQRELFLDVCENTIAKSVASGDTQDAKWVLSRLGKKRGYGDNIDVTSAGQTIINIVERKTDG